MTVISTLITKYGTVHATDSLITKPAEGNKREIVEGQRAKIVKVRHFRGAMSYWGAADIPSSNGNGSTLDWLNKEAQQANKYPDPEQFAQAVASYLGQVLPPRRGIGIHLTAYEYIGNYWIPELFLISNYADPDYQELRALDVSRETYKTISNEEPKPEHREEEYRLAVHRDLQTGGNLIYNNGDPDLFNPIANALLDALKSLDSRGVLKKTPDLEFFRCLAILPIEFVANLQKKDFCELDTRRVGGKLHSLSITPEGVYFPDKGNQ
jgi:hypothetical protein